MTFDELNNNPLLQNMAPDKLQFLLNFASASKPTSMKDMAPFLLGTINQAKSKNIQFSESETDLLITLLKQNMSDEEAAKADKLIQLMRERKPPKSSDS